MVIQRINTGDISIIIQGAVDPVNTPLCLNSIRKQLPGAEIILSTWQGTDTASLNCDTVLYCEDPGGTRDKQSHSFVNNTLRQLVSTKAGVAKAAGKYILKMRSDLILKSNRFLSHFEDFPMRRGQYALFRHRVIASSFFSKKFCSSRTESQPLPFHLNDWFVFGLAEDVSLLYASPLPDEPENAWYLTLHPYPGVKTNLLHCSHRYAPEQYIFFQACKNRFPQIQFEHYLDYDRENILWSEQIIANNCIILNPSQFRFICGKKKTGTDYYKRWTKHESLIPKTLKMGLYTYRTFCKDYKKYCLEAGDGGDAYETGAG